MTTNEGEALARPVERDGGEASLAVLAPRDDDKHRDAALAFIATLQSTSSRRTARAALNRVASIFMRGESSSDPERWLKMPWCNIGPRETTFIQAALTREGEGGYSVNTAKTTMAMLRGVLGQAFRLGHIGAEQYQRSVMTGKIKGSQLGSGRELTRDEIGALRLHVSRLPSPYRELVACLFAIALGCGLRRDELARLVTSDAVDEKHLKVRGKGNKERLQPMPPWTRAAVRRWLDVREKFGLHVGSFFVRITQDGKVHDDGLSTWGVWKLVSSTIEEAGIAPSTPHDMRRSFATALLRKGVDLSTVQKLMGHASMTTTVRYDKRGQDVADDVVEKIGDWGLSDPLQDAGDGSEEDDLLIFHKGEQAVTKGWVRQQVALLEGRGLSRKAAVEALVRVGVTKHGRSIEVSDL